MKISWPLTLVRDILNNKHMENTEETIAQPQVEEVIEQAPVEEVVIPVSKLVKTVEHN